MQPIRLNTKKMDRATRVSLVLAVLIHAAGWAAFREYLPGIRDHVFILLASDEIILDLEIGETYAVLPAAPRFAAFLVADEDRYDPDRFQPGAEKERPSEPAAEAAPVIAIRPDADMALPLDADFRVARVTATGWDRQTLLADPNVRITAGTTDLPAPSASKGSPVPAIAEERFVPSSQTPIMAEARPGALNMLEAATITAGESLDNPAGEESGIDFAMIRETPIMARRVVPDNPDAPFPEALVMTPPAAPAAGAKISHWLVEEERFDPREKETTVGQERNPLPPDADLGPARLLLAISGQATGPQPETQSQIANMQETRRRPPMREISETNPENALPPPLIIEESEPEPEPESEPEPEPEIEPEPEPEAESEPEEEAAPEPPDSASDAGEVMDTGKSISITRGYAAIYPERSRRRGETGTVVVSVEIDAEGRLSDIWVERSSGFPALDQAALDAFVGVRFRPAIRDGRPEVMVMEFPFEFVLH